MKHDDRDEERRRCGLCGKILRPYGSISVAEVAIEEYRRLVARAIYPDPFSKRRVSVRDAAAAIVEYRRSTGDEAGTVDLMLTLVEAGTEQAADLGYGDEAYFSALQIRLDAVAKEFETLPADVRAKVRARLDRIQVRARDVGWGFNDAVEEVIHALDARAAPVRQGTLNRRRSRRESADGSRPPAPHKARSVRRVPQS